ncbi:hypothetical protein WJX82_002440 [Trebouxia sp. C0006]
MQHIGATLKGLQQLCTWAAEPSKLDPHTTSVGEKSCQQTPRQALKKPVAAGLAVQQLQLSMKPNWPGIQQTGLYTHLKTAPMITRSITWLLSVLTITGQLQVFRRPLDRNLESKKCVTLHKGELGQLYQALDFLQPLPMAAAQQLQEMVNRLGPRFLPDETTAAKLSDGKHLCAALEQLGLAFTANVPLSGYWAHAVLQPQDDSAAPVVLVTDDSGYIDNKDNRPTGRAPAGTAQRRIELQLCGHRDSPTAGVVERAMPLSSSQISKEMLRGKQLVSLCTFGHYLATAAAFAIAHHTNQHSVEVHQGSASLCTCKLSSRANWAAEPLEGGQVDSQTIRPANEKPAQQTSRQVLAKPPVACLAVQDVQCSLKPSWPGSQQGRSEGQLEKPQQMRFHTTFGDSTKGCKVNHRGPERTHNDRTASAQAGVQQASRKVSRILKMVHPAQGNDIGLVVLVTGHRDHIKNKDKRLTGRATQMLWLHLKAGLAHVAEAISAGQQTTSKDTVKVQGLASQQF